MAPISNLSHGTGFHHESPLCNSYTTWYFYQIPLIRSASNRRSEFHSKMYVVTIWNLHQQNMTYEILFYINQRWYFMHDLITIRCNSLTTTILYHPKHANINTCSIPVHPLGWCSGQPRNVPKQVLHLCMLLMCTGKWRCIRMLHRI